MSKGIPLENGGDFAANASEVPPSDESEVMPTEDSVEPGSSQTLEFADIGIDTGDKSEESLGEQPIADQIGSSALTEQIESLKAQLEERTGQYMRIAADFDNFRKRTQKEKEDLEQQVKCSTIVEMLPVVDNFERARSQIKPQTDSEMNIHKSYQSVYKQLVDCLKRIGVAPMRSEGKEFDPNLHEAVLREPTEEYPEGTVMEELVRGYLLGDRILRHAMVKVAATPEVVITSDGETQGDEEQ
jgi:molecular chaperone GrpE